jgi:hypothetical protein
MTSEKKPEQGKHDAKHDAKPADVKKDADQPIRKPGDGGEPVPGAHPLGAPTKK